MKTRREIQKEKIFEKYKQVYIDGQKGMSFKEISKKHGYKNSRSARVTYYSILSKIERGEL